MALDTKTRLINGRSVEVTMLPAMYANSLFTTVLKYFGPIIAQAMGLFNSVAPQIAELQKDKKKEVSLLDLDLDWKEVVSIINELTAKLTPEEWQAFCLKVLAQTDVQLVPTDIKKIRIMDELAFNAVFTGKLLFMVKVLFFTLEVNYGDFFGEGGFGIIPNPPEKTTEKSKA